MPSCFCHRRHTTYQHWVLDSLVRRSLDVHHWSLHFVLAAHSFPHYCPTPRRHDTQGALQLGKIWPPHQHLLHHLPRLHNPLVTIPAIYAGHSCQHELRRTGDRPGYHFCNSGLVCLGQEEIRTTGRQGGLLRLSRSLHERDIYYSIGWRI